MSSRVYYSTISLPILTASPRPKQPNPFFSSLTERKAAKNYSYKLLKLLLLTENQFWLSAAFNATLRTVFVRIFQLCSHSMMRMPNILPFSCLDSRGRREWRDRRSRKKKLCVLLMLMLIRSLLFFPVSVSSGGSLNVFYALFTVYSSASPRLRVFFPLLLPLGGSKFKLKYLKKYIENEKKKWEKISISAIEKKLIFQLSLISHNKQRIDVRNQWKLLTMTFFFFLFFFGSRFDDRWSIDSESSPQFINEIHPSSWMDRANCEWICSFSIDSNVNVRFWKFNIFIHETTDEEIHIQRFWLLGVGAIKSQRWRWSNRIKEICELIEVHYIDNVSADVKKYSKKNF